MSIGIGREGYRRVATAGAGLREVAGALQTPRAHARVGTPFAAAAGAEGSRVEG
jgi:hypothetical protein